MDFIEQFPEDFQAAVRFHGHLCLGLAIGYAAAKAAASRLGVGASPDEEVVAIVENDSCAVDAVQVVLGCTFGKGNLVFRDWGKQVFTFVDRGTGRAVRVSFRGGETPDREDRRSLKERIDSGQADEADKKRWEALTRNAIMAIIRAPSDEFFEVKQVNVPMPPFASIVTTAPCDLCGELTVTTKMVFRDGRTICQGCALRRD